MADSGQSALFGPDLPPIDRRWMEKFVRNLFADMKRWHAQGKNGDDHG